MMTRFHLTPRLLVAAFITTCATLGGAFAASAATAPGTVISNTSSAVYSDANSNSYTTNSATVSVTVQNAPSMVVTAGTGQTVAPGQTITDTFSIQNTGNASGNVALGADATIAGTQYRERDAVVLYGYDRQRDDPVHHVGESQHRTCFAGKRRRRQQLDFNRRYVCAFVERNVG
jgi:hypothetical protein